MNGSVRGWWGTALAVAATLVAALVRLALDPWLGNEVPLFVFLLSVLACAWLAGYGAALLALALGLAAGSWLFVEPRFGFGTPDPQLAARMFGFAGVGMALALVVPRLAQSARVAQQGFDEFRAIFENSAAGLSQVDTRLRRIVRVNDAFCRIVGYTPDELRRIPPDELTHPEDRERAHACVDALLRGVIREYTIEKRYLRKDGRPVWVQVTVNAIRDRHGRIVRTSALVQDIEERRRIAEERESLLVSERRARGDAERANRSKDEFVATLSHELRTPLNAILGWVQLLRRGRLDAATAERGLAVIERNTRVQTQLISDLLDVNRIVSGKMRLEFGPVRLQTVVASAVESMSPDAAAKRIAIDARIDPLVPPTMGDAARLQQVVLNLLTNAVKFTPSGGRISVQLARQGSEASLRVIDNGEGIAAGFLPMLFERYRQADEGSMRQFGGLGLGLSIVRHLTELHGGSVEASSEGPGRGSTFTVTLPLLSETEWVDRRGPAAEPPSDLSGVRVLAVDDDPEAREVIRRVLQSFGAEVDTAASADQALEMIDSSVPDVLVCDISMPQKDGYALIEAVRGLARGGALPAVALTAFARAEDRARALRAGFHEHLSKPVDAAALAGAVAALHAAGPSAAGNDAPVTADTAPTR